MNNREMAERDQALLNADVSRVRSLLSRLGAEDLMDMITGGMDDALLISSMPSKLNGRS